MLIKIDQSFYKELTETERQIITFINENAGRISNMSISTVAEETFSSSATVSRTVRKCGISGFAELRYLLSTQNTESKDLIQVNEVLKKSVLEATNTVDHLSVNDILKVISLIQTAPRIYILSRGLTELVADEFSLKLQLLGYNIFSISDAAIMQKVTADIRRDELVFIFSLSGKTEELIVSAENAISCGAKLVTCTCGANTPLVKMATVPFIGYKHQHISIKKVDATSRFPLYILSRILIDYLILESEKPKKRSL